MSARRKSGDAPHLFDEAAEIDVEGKPHHFVEGTEEIVEVMGESDIQAVLDPFTHAPHDVVTIGPKRARAALRVAIAQASRARRPVYVSDAAPLFRGSQRPYVSLR